MKNMNDKIFIANYKNEISNKVYTIVNDIPGSKIELMNMELHEFMKSLNKL